MQPPMSTFLHRFQVAPFFLTQQLRGIPILRGRTAPVPERISLQFQYPSILSPNSPLRLIFCSATITDTEKVESFTVSYLIDNFGFSPQKARIASKRVQLEDSGRPEKVVKFFKDYGFSDSQVKRLIQADATLLLSVPENRILAKLEFLSSQGFSRPELLKMIAGSPTVLRRSLDNQIMPLVQFIKSHQSDSRKALADIKTSLSQVSSVAVMKRNISFLRQSGMPESKIAMLLGCWASRQLNSSTKDLEILVERVKGMGFDINKSTFLVALSALTIDKTKWQRKFNIYKKWGWSEQDFLRAFKRDPWCMLTSEHKIEVVMDFMVNQIGWNSLVLAEYPIVFRMSLEKRIIPRARVLQYLVSNGLAGDKYISVFRLSDKQFLEKFVEPFPNAAPQILELYQENNSVTRPPTLLQHGS